MRKLGARILLPYHLHLLADVSVLLGQVEQGLAAVGEALALIEETGARVFESELRRLQGELLRMAGREEEAMRSLLRADVHHERGHEPYRDGGQRLADALG